MEPNYNTFVPPGSYQQQAGPNKKLIMLIVGVVVAVIIGVVLLLASNSGESTMQLTQRLQARLLSVQTMTENSHEHLTDTGLRNLNAETRLVLESDLATLSSDLGLGDSEPSEEIAAQESDQATLDKLEEARLQGAYNEAYRSALATKLEATNALVSEIYDKSNDETVKATMEELFNHYADLQDRAAATKP